MKKARVYDASGTDDGFLNLVIVSIYLPRFGNKYRLKPV
jgi:hypothetical protein